MFGTNPVAKSRASKNTIMIHSMRHTIQGEGPFAGMPAIFVRTGGCNLKCALCDTEFDAGVIERTPNEVAQAIRTIAYKYNTDLVVITGGEPMLQPLDLLLSQKGNTFQFQIETAGSIWPKETTLLDHHEMSSTTIVCSPKTPKVAANFEAWPNTYWKYIVRASEPVSEVDGLPEYSTQILGNKAKLFRPKYIQRERIFIQAWDEGKQYENKLNVEYATQICMKYGYRLSIQLHKLPGVMLP